MKLLTTHQLEFLEQLYNFSGRNGKLNNEVSVGDVFNAYLRLAILMEWFHYSYKVKTRLVKVLREYARFASVTGKVISIHGIKNLYNISPKKVREGRSDSSTWKTEEQIIDKPSPTLFMQTLTNRFLYVINGDFQWRSFIRPMSMEEIIVAGRDRKAARLHPMLTNPVGGETWLAGEVSILWPLQTKEPLCIIANDRSGHYRHQLTPDEMYSCFIESWSLSKQTSVIMLSGQSIGLSPLLAEKLL